MPTAPPDPERGEDILRWARAINRIVRAIIPRESADVLPSVGTAGTTFALRRRRGASGGSGAPPCPLGLYDASEGGTTKIGVRWGRLNGDEPADFDTQGRKITTVLSEGYVYAKVTFDHTNGGTVSARAIVVVAAVQTNTPTIGYELLGTFETIGDTLSVVGQCGDVDISPCDLPDEEE